MIKKSIKNILVPLDGSTNSLRGLDTAISLARACRGIITGVYVIPIYPRNLLDAVIPYHIYLEKDAKKFIQKAKLRSAQNGIQFKSKIIAGSPIYEIENMLKGKKFDLIVIGSRGRGSAKEMFLGSVSHAIVHKSKIPVVIVK